MRWRMFRRYCGALSEGSALCRKDARVNISVRERARFFEKSAVPIGPRLPCIHGTTPRANVPNAQIGVWFHGLMLPAAADIIADMSLKTPHFSTTKSATLATAALVGAFRMADPSAKFSRRRPYTRMRARASTVARLPEWLVRSQPRDYHDRRCRFAETVVEGTIRGAAGHSCAAAWAWRAACFRPTEHQVLLGGGAEDESLTFFLLAYFARRWEVTTGPRSPTAVVLVNFSSSAVRVLMTRCPRSPAGSAACWPRS